ncbi:hypothetical protein ES703_45339 [subsurface metagenome]
MFPQKLISWQNPGINCLVTLPSFSIEVTPGLYNGIITLEYRKYQGFLLKTGK